MLRPSSTSCRYKVASENLTQRGNVGVWCISYPSNYLSIQGCRSASPKPKVLSISQPATLTLKSVFETFAKQVFMNWHILAFEAKSICLLLKSMETPFLCLCLRGNVHQASHFGDLTNRQILIRGVS